MKQAYYQDRFIVLNKKHLSSKIPLDVRINFFDALDEVYRYMPHNTYYVCNQDEDYASDIIKIILDGETEKLNE